MNFSNNEINCCTDFILHCLKESNGIPDSIIKVNNKCVIYAKYNNCIKEFTYNDSSLDKEISIYLDGSSHLRMFDKIDNEIYYRDSHGTQIIKSGDRVISRIDYLDDCVLCRDNIVSIFNTLFNQ